MGQSTQRAVPRGGHVSGGAAKMPEHCLEKGAGGPDGPIYTLLLSERGPNAKNWLRNALRRTWGSRLFRKIEMDLAEGLGHIFTRSCANSSTNSGPNSARFWKASTCVPNTFSWAASSGYGDWSTQSTRCVLMQMGVRTRGLHLGPHQIAETFVVERHMRFAIANLRHGNEAWR